MTQLTLDLRQTRRPGREQRPIERLHALLRRRNINPTWRTDGNHRMWILPLVGIDVGDRHRTEPRSADSSLPVQGVWETLCAWHVNAAPHCPEVVPHYRERSDIHNHSR